MGGRYLAALAGSRAPSSAARRSEEALQVGSDLPQSARDRLEGAGPAHGAMPRLEREGQEDDHRVHRDRPRADRLWWGGSGLCFFAKRPEEGQFRWPTIEDGVMRLTSAQLQALLERLDWRRVHAVRRTRAPLSSELTPAG